VDITQIEAEDRQLNELQPDEVFMRKCEEQGFNLDEYPEILDAFYEVLNEINDN
jgi:exonuclease SbcD